MFRDWKEIYLTSTIPVLWNRAPFVTFSKSFGRRVFFEDLRDVNRFFSFKKNQKKPTNKYTKKQIYILDPLVCNTPSSSREPENPYGITVSSLYNIFWLCFETASCYLFLILPTPSTLFPVKFSLRIIKAIFPVAFILPCTKLYSPVRSAGNIQATLTVWNKMYNILQLDLPFFFFLRNKIISEVHKVFKLAISLLKKPWPLVICLGKLHSDIKETNETINYSPLYLLSILCYVEILIWGQSMSYFFNRSAFRVLFS